VEVGEPEAGEGFLQLLLSELLPLGGGEGPDVHQPLHPGPAEELHELGEGLVSVTHHPDLLPNHRVIIGRGGFKGGRVVG
jgi:hypothetical protein